MEELHKSKRIGGIRDKEILGRCWLGHFDGQEIPNHTDMCIWANRKWGSYVEVFEMCDHHFLFEFPTDHGGAHSYRGLEWERKALHLPWWSTASGCMTENWWYTRTWIRILGLPLKLGKKEMMKEIKKDAEGESKTKKPSSKIICDVLTCGSKETRSEYLVTSTLIGRVFSIPSPFEKTVWKESAFGDLQTVAGGSKAGIGNSLGLGLDDMADPILGGGLIKFKPSVHASTHGKKLMENLEDAILSEVGWPKFTSQTWQN